MKLSPNEFHLCDKLEPFRVQDLKTGEVIEFYYMNDLEQGIFDTFIAKKQLEIQSTLDSKRFRVLIEKGLYEQISDFYSDEANIIFIELLRVLDKPQKYNKLAMLPAGIIVLGLFVANLFFKNDMFRYIIIGVVVALLIYLIFINNFFKRKSQQISLEYQKKFEELVGQARILQLMELRDQYSQEFLHNRSMQYDAELDAEHNSEIILKETTVKTDEVDELILLNEATRDSDCCSCSCSKENEDLSIDELHNCSKSLEENAVDAEYDDKLEDTKQSDEIIDLTE